MKRIFQITSILLFVFIQAAAQFGPGFDNVTIKGYASFDKIHIGSELKIAVEAVVNESWHINSVNPNEEFLIPSELQISCEAPLNLVDVKFPDAKNIKFSFSEKPVSVYEGEFLIGGIVKTGADAKPGKYNLIITLSYQACNDQSCLPPTSAVDTLAIEIVDTSKPYNQINQEIFSKIDLSLSSEISSDDDDSIESLLESSGIVVSIILVFLGGLALNLTPCVYPLIPITVGYFGGQSEGRTSRLFLLGVVYVLGMALTYSVIGVVTAMSGAVFGALLQNPIVIIAIALVLVALALSMFGVYEFKLPDSLVAKAGGAKTGMFGAFFMGLTLGIVAAPCIGPFVLGLLTYVAAKADVFYGFIMFFFLAVGLGSPYLVLALFSGKIKNLPRAGEWMEGVKHIFGFILVGMALYFLEPLLPESFGTYVLPVFMIIGAMYLLFIDKMGNDVKGFKYFKYIFSVALIAVAVYFAYPTEKVSPAWQNYSEGLYESSLSSNKKIMIDFYADWCIPCKELDALTFSDQRVIELSKEFVNIKVDLTKTMSDETEIIRNKFNILGMPTILLINTDGTEAKRLTGFVDAEEFLSIMSGVK